MNTFAQHVIDFLTAQSLHVLILFAAVLAATFLLRGRSAHIRYLLWLLIVAKCLVPPLHTVSLAVLPEADAMDVRSSGFSLTENKHAEARTANTDAAQDVLSSSFSLLENPPAKARPASTVGTAYPVAESRLEAGGTADERPAASDATGKQSKIGGLSFKLWIPTVWLGGAAAYFLVMAVNGVRFDRYVRRHRTEVTATSHPAWAGYLAAAVGERRVRVYQLDRSGQPFVWGLWRGAVYLPGNFADVNNSQKQQSILMHEAGHILRYDPVVNLLQVVAQGLFWFHPLVWAANRIIRAEREKCCDEFAVAKLKTAPRHYCTAIVDALMAAQPSRPAVPTLAVAGPVKNIEDRIKTLLAPGKIFRTRPTAAAIISILLLAAIVVPTTVALSHRVRPEIRSQAAEIEKTPIEDQLTQRAFLDAVRNGSIPTVKQYISQGINVNITNNQGTTALHEAGPWGQTEIAKLLIESGANVNQEDNNSQTPLHKAASYSHQAEPTAQLLIDNGAIVTLSDDKGMTPLHYACTGSMCHMLTEKGADIHARDQRGWTPLHYDSNWGRLSAIQYLVENGADSEARDNEGRTPLMLACTNAYHTVAEYLINQNANLSATDNQGRTPLHWAVMKNEDQIRTLLNGQRAGDGQSQDAVDRHYSKIGDTVKLLLAHGADVAAADKHGLIPLDYAAKASNESAILILTGGKKTEIRTQDIEFFATLANGVTVELVGVCEHPSDGRQWWRPDGSELKDKPWDKMQHSVSVAGGRKAYEIAYKLDNAPGLNAQIKWVGSRSSGNNNNLCVEIVELPHNLETTDMHFAVSSGPWQTHYTQECPWDGVIVYTSGIVWHAPIAQGEKTILSIAHSFFKDQDRLVAIDKQGNEHVGFGPSGSIDGKTSNMQVTFNIKIDDIKEFQIQTRPYEHYTFKNVSLRPGGKTNMEIETQSSLANPEASGKKKTLEVDLNSLFLACQMYRIDTGKWPETVDDLLRKDGRGPYIIPNDTYDFSQLWFVRPYVNYRQVTDPAKTHFLYDISMLEEHKEIAVVYLDGHVEFLNREHKELIGMGFTFHPSEPPELNLFPSEFPALRYPASQAESSKHQTANYTATLPNGVTVELVGLCESPGDGKQWWTPHEYYLAEKPYAAGRVKTFPNENQKGYEFVLRFNTLAQDMDVKVEVVQEHSGSADSMENIFNQETGRYEGWYDKAVALDADVTECDLLIGIPSDQWSTVLEHRGSGTLSTSGSEGDIVFSQASETNGSSSITVSHQIKGQFARLIVVDKDGREHSPSGQKTAGLNVIQMTAEFALPLNQIETFRLQKRPFVWATIRNVPLVPGDWPTLNEQVKPAIAFGKSELIEKLPRGGTITFAGVRNFSEPGKPWYSPDGSSRVDIKESSGGYSALPGGSGYEFNIMLETPYNKITKTTRVRWVFEPKPLFVYGFSEQWSGGVDDRRFAGQFDNDVEKVNVTLEISNGPWKTIAVNGTADGVVDIEAGGKRQPVEFRNLREDSGRVYFNILHPIRDQAHQVVAVLKDGNARYAGEYRENEYGKVDVRFDGLNLANVDRFEFQTQETDVVYFKNVSLRAGDKTNVEVEIDDGESMPDEKPDIHTQEGIKRRVEDYFEENEKEIVERQTIFTDEPYLSAGHVFGDYNFVATLSNGQKKVFHKQFKFNDETGNLISVEDKNSTIDPNLELAMTYTSEMNGGNRELADRSLAESYYLAFLQKPDVQSWQKAAVYNLLGAIYVTALNREKGETRNDEKARTYFRKVLEVEPLRIGRSTVRARSMLSTLENDGGMERIKARMDFYTWLRQIDEARLEEKWLPSNLWLSPDEAAQPSESELRGLRNLLSSLKETTVYNAAGDALGTPQEGFAYILGRIPESEPEWNVIQKFISENPKAKAAVKNIALNPGVKTEVDVVVDEGKLTISGQVIDQDTDEPIVGALVRAAASRVDMRKMRVPHTEKLYETTTDKNGHFSIELSSNDAEFASIDVLAKGYQTIAGTFRSGGDIRYGFLPLKHYESRPHNIKLKKALYVAGRVVDENGNSIKDVYVSGQMDAEKSLSFISETQTNNAGQFELFDFPLIQDNDETGKLVFIHPQYEKVIISDLYDRDENERSSYAIVLPKGLRVAGIVLDADGEPASGLTVEAALDEECQAVLRDSVTDSNGYFEIAGLPKQTRMTLRTSTDDYTRKATQILAPFDKNEEIVLELLPIEKADVETYSFLGVKVADITPALRKQFDIPEMMSGVVIVDPGKDSNRLGIGDLKAGYYFWMAGNNKIASLKAMVSEILRIHAKPIPQGGMVTEGYEGRIRVVYGERKGTNTQYLKLTEQEAEQLRRLGSQIGVSEELLDSKALKEKVKADLQHQYQRSLDKLISINLDANPDNEPLNLQFAIAVVCGQAEIPDNSVYRADRKSVNLFQKIHPIHIENKPTREVLVEILDSLGLTYTIDELGLYLIPQNLSENVALRPDVKTAVEVVTEKSGFPAGMGGFGGFAKTPFVAVPDSGVGKKSELTTLPLISVALRAISIPNDDTRLQSFLKKADVTMPQFAMSVSADGTETQNPDKLRYGPFTLVSPGDVQKIIKAAQSEADSRMLTSPKVVVVSGEEAVMEVPRVTSDERKKFAFQITPSVTAEGILTEFRISTPETLSVSDSTAVQTTQIMSKIIVPQDKVLLILGPDSFDDPSTATSPQIRTLFLLEIYENQQPG